MPEAPKVHTATINIFARDIVNPDQEGVASPVQVRVYLSDEIASFDGVSFEQLFGYDGNEFPIKPTVVQTISPGSVMSVDIEISSQLQAIAVAAAFQDIGRSSWLEVFKLKNSKPTNLNFILTDFDIKHEKE